MSEKSQARRGWRVVGLLFLFMMINYADKSVLGFVALPMMRDMQLSPTQFGLLGSAFYLLYSVAGVTGGVLTRYVKARWILLLLALIWAAVQFPMATPVGFGTLVVCRVLLGAGEGPAYPVALHAVYKWFDDHKRSVPTSIVQTGAPLGVVVAAPALTALMERYSWRASFVALGIVGLVWAAMWLLWGEEGRGDRHERRAVDAAGHVGVLPYRRLLLDPTVVVVTVQWFLAALIAAIGLTWGPVYLNSVLGYGTKEIGWIFAIQVAAQVPLGLAINALSQSMIGRGVTTRVARGIFCSLCCAVGAITYLVLLTHAAPVAKVAWLTIGGAFVMQVNAFGPQIIAEMTPESQRGTVIAVAVSVASTAGVLGPLMLGGVMDAMGGLNRDSGAFAFVYGGIGTALLVAAVLGFALLDPARSKRRLAALERADAARPRSGAAV
ncbi:MFS transporter [Burkholderia pseudomultivorans]|uniref:MFS transporter n=1 Tax=Burkholderia pseudomultivorans TaxID=1207504 RepID=UPI0018902A58|nr:MFS transporter [Burkholderia pseudomultivorans]MBF5010239.1 MFS transporter [Burkholderia pseudomultivorans]